MDNVEQIRQLILGEQLQNYDKDIQKLRADLKSLQSDLDQFVSAFRKELEAMRQQRGESVQSIEKMLVDNREALQKQLKTAEADLLKMARDLESSGAKREDLAKLLIDMGAKLGDGKDQ